MKTYYVATTNYLPVKNYCGFKIKYDFAVFDDIQQLDAFISGQGALDAKDDFTVLDKDEHLSKVFCILANNVSLAINRAFDLRDR